MSKFVYQEKDPFVFGRDDPSLLIGLGFKREQDLADGIGWLMERNVPFEPTNSDVIIIPQDALDKLKCAREIELSGSQGNLKGLDRKILFQIIPVVEITDLSEEERRIFREEQRSKKTILEIIHREMLNMAYG